MRIYDVFPFFNELDLLEIRLNTLDEFVDEFIITEADTTFSGLPKPFYASEALKTKFQKFAHKITIQKVRNIPATLDPFQRDHFQRDKVQDVLNRKMTSRDLLIYGDVDEIPSPRKLKAAIEMHDSQKINIIHFAQDIYYCYLNQKEISGTLLSYTGEYKNVFRKKWLGTNISKRIYSQNFTPTHLRHPIHKKNGIRLKNGGWHFSYIGSEGIVSAEERVHKKIVSAAHQEFNQSTYLDELDDRIQNSKDIFSRKRSRYKILNNLEYLPDFILNNVDQYEHLIKRK
jgi:beta-1,4-mannosyl-glycoprotein beta-1,4-N-acetylglucosaminyltransferase